jgi:hypothetical protein
MHKTNDSVFPSCTEAVQTVGARVNKKGDTNGIAHVAFGIPSMAEGYWMQNNPKL